LNPPFSPRGEKKVKGRGMVERAKHNEPLKVSYTCGWGKSGI